MHRVLIFAAGVALTAAVAVSQPVPTPPPAAASLDDAGGAVKPRRGQSAQATREFLGLGVAPDAAAAKRGAPVYAANCAGCHGAEARGGIGPSLIYSNQVLDDDHGEKLVGFLKAGRPEKGMPSFAESTPQELTDIAEFLHLQVEAYANRGTYENKNNILTGDVRHGAAYFAANCTACHSASGDLKGIGARLRPLDLQRTLIVPTREDHPTRAVTATVTSAGTTVTGRVVRIDDFEVVIADAAGATHTIERGPGVAVALTDPLAWHKAFATRVKDREMTDLTTYLASFK